MGLRELSKGQRVEELPDIPRTFVGWVAIKPRGFVNRDALVEDTDSAMLDVEDTDSAMLDVATSAATSGTSAAAEDSQVHKAVEAVQVTIGDSLMLPAVSRRRVGSLLTPDQNDILRVWRGKRPLSPQPDFVSRAGRARTDVGARQDKAHDIVYVLDALNVLKHRNDDDLPVELNWHQLRAAGQYYTKRQLKVYAFLRHTRDWDWQSPKLIQSRLS